MRKRAICLHCGKFVPYRVKEEFETQRRQEGTFTYKRIFPVCKYCGEELYVDSLCTESLNRMDRAHKKMREDKKMRRRLECQTCSKAKRDPAGIIFPCDELECNPVGYSSTGTTSLTSLPNTPIQPAPEFSLTEFRELVKKETAKEICKALLNNPWLTYEGIAKEYNIDIDELF